MKATFLLLSLLAVCFFSSCDVRRLNRVSQGNLHFTIGKVDSIPHWNEEGWTHFFFVRHAEKLPSPADGLSEKGLKRARRLGNIMKDADLDLVFTTHTVRTRSTADSVRIRYNNIPGPTPEYPTADEAETAWLRQQLQENRGKRIFVVGHSNTVPRMVNKLMGPGSALPDIDEKIFTLFYVVASRDIGDSEYLLNGY